MANVWIIAQAEGNEAPSRITSEPVTSSDEGTTVVQDSNGDTATAPPTKSVSSLVNFLPLILIFVAPVG